MTKPTVPDAIITTGWSKGIAAQVSLPMILLPSLRRDCRHMTRRNPVEQTLAHPRVGLRPVGLGGPRQLLKRPRLQDPPPRLGSVAPVLHGLRFSRQRIEAAIAQ